MAASCESIAFPYQFHSQTISCYSFLNTGFFSGMTIGLYQEMPDELLFWVSPGMVKLSEHLVLTLSRTVFPSLVLGGNRSQSTFLLRELGSSKNMDRWDRVGKR